MAFSKQNRSNTLSGILFVALFAMSATYLAQFEIFHQFAISPLIIGIVLGIFYANTLRHKLPVEWQAGVLFSTKMILRAGIVFYGFRLTFQNIAEVGIAGLIVSTCIVSLTFVIGYFVGTKLLKLDRDTTILISAGSSICGAAAVLATEPVLKAESYKTSIAVATVVVFGTIAMFLYPFLYKSGLLGLNEQAMGIYLGGTLHEVAHVVGAGNAINESVANTAVIVKMLRVMLLAPFLVILSLWLKDKVTASTDTGVNTNNNNPKSNITIPWFALGFIAMVGFNSLNLLPQNFVSTINSLDTFALTMAMTALGMETRAEKFKGIGLKPIYLASILFVWLLFGGYFLTRFAVN
ncbi:MAG: YeiH family putative sulfate export transporter [Alteromonadaceae bacterium]|nr:YeiH family putative sulfate export transporter [Alteromonadaceae bacterium]